MNLFEKGDFVHQQTEYWCVAASVQTMMNIIDPGKPNRSIPYQKKLYQRGRELSVNQAKLGSIGIDLSGWAGLLNKNGYGPYVVEASDTRRGAIRKAVGAFNDPRASKRAYRASRRAMCGEKTRSYPAFACSSRQKSSMTLRTTAWRPRAAT